MQENMFKSVLDAFLYLLLYFVVPLAQYIAYNILEDSSVWFVSLLMTGSLFYDSYTRYDGRKLKKFRVQMVIIGAVALVLTVYSCAVMIISATGVSVSSLARIPYIILVVPFCVALVDLIGVCKATVG